MVKENFDLGNGDVFYMFGDCQQKYTHSVLQIKNNPELIGPRIAVTFRQMNC